jgi:hypothetical protein
MQNWIVRLSVKYTVCLVLTTQTRFHIFTKDDKGLEKLYLPRNTLDPKEKYTF